MPAPFNDTGRSIVGMVKLLVGFYERHRAVLVTELSTEAIAALDAVAAALAAIELINPPGPG